MLPWTQLFQFTIYSHFNHTIYAHEKANVTCYVIVTVKVSAYIDTSTSVKSNYNTHYLNTYCKLTNIYFQQKFDITKNLALQVLYYSTSKLSRQRHRMVISLMHWPLLPPRNTPGAHFWVDSRAIVWPEGLCHWKIPTTPSGIEPTTCQFVA